MPVPSRGEVMKKAAVFLAVLAGCGSEDGLDEFHRVSKDQIHVRNLPTDPQAEKSLKTDDSVWGFEFIAGSDGVLDLVVHDRVGTIPSEADFFDDPELKEKVIIARQVRVSANRVVALWCGHDKEGTVMVMSIEGAGAERGAVLLSRQNVSKASLPERINQAAYAGSFNLDQGKKGFSVAEAKSVVSLHSWGWRGDFGGIGPERGEGSTVTLNIDGEQGVALDDHEAPVWVLRMRYTPGPK